MSGCTCGYPGLTYDGPHEDCPIHGLRREWDLSTPFSPAKSIHLPFVNYGDHDECGKVRIDGWGVERYCNRLPGHTGRHRANERLDRYPVAVWS